jgi:hypothetical protein
MTRWIVTNVPSWLLFAVLVVGITAGTIAALAYVRRRFPQLADGAHNDIARSGFGVVGPVWGFMIGFIVSALWGQVGAADNVVRMEGAAAVQIARELSAFNQADSDRIRERLLAYEHAAIDEWPEAINGHAAPEAEAALVDLHSAFDGIQPADEKQRRAVTSSLDSLKQLGSSRTERMVMARTNIGPPMSLWGVIFLTSGLVLGFAVIIGEKQVRMHYAMVAAVSVLVAALLFLVMELAFPFHGEMGTSPEALRVATEAAQDQ